MKIAMQPVFSILALTALVLPFQNCGDVSFATANPESALVGPLDQESPLVNLPEINIPTIVDEPDETYQDEVEPPAYANNPGAPVEPIAPDEEDEQPEPNENKPTDTSTASLNYICILEGPGDSVRLGAFNGVLASNGRTPQTICTTEKACLETVSLAFPVKSAEQRGFCGKNEHAISMTQAELAQLIQ